MPVSGGGSTAKYEAIIVATQEPNGIVNGDELSFTAGGTSGNEITISSTSNKIKYYYRGSYGEITTPVTKAVDSVTVGNSFLYVNINTVAVMPVASVPSASWFFYIPLICSVYYNLVESFISRETHGIKMDGATHELLHRTIGCRYQNDGGLAGTFTSSGFSMTGGSIWDEDIEGQIGAKTQCRVYYRDGTTWLRTALQDKYFYDTGGLKYDNSGVLTSVSSNNYMAMWIFATLDVDAPIIAIMGQRTDTTLANAQANNTYEGLVLGTLPAPEMKLLYRVIIRNHATLYQSANDYRASSVVGGVANTVQSHAALSGLSANDHPQYLLVGDSPVVSASSQADVTYTTLSSAAGKLFTGYKPIVTYEAGSHTIDLSNIIDKITIQGDTRGLAGLSYMHGSAVVSTATGAGVGTITLSSSGNDVTVACSTTNPDFSTLVAGDKLLICNTAKAIAEYEIASVSGNTITLTTSAPTINSKAGCITIVPNRTISTALSIDHENRITFQGFKFTSTTTVSGKAEFKNCVWASISTNAISVNGGDVKFTNAENTVVNATNIGLSVLHGGRVKGKINVNKATTGIEIDENSVADVSYSRVNNTTTCFSARAASFATFTYCCAFTSTNGFYARHCRINCDNTVVDTLDYGYYASYYGGGQAYGYSASGISSLWNTSTGYWLY